MSLNPFTWFGDKKEVPAGKTTPRRPSLRDMTGGYPANEELYLGLYHGTYAGLEKASPLARVPINTLVSLMGVPTPTAPNSPKTQEKLDAIRRMMAQEIRAINKLCVLIGTAWVYPKWDSKTGQGLVWKLIRDACVVDQLRSLTTEMPRAIITDEQIRMSVGENDVRTVRRKTTYTYDNVTVVYQGATDDVVKDHSSRNVARTLPVMFSNGPDDPNERGHSELEPCLCDFKDYHDVDHRVSDTLARFRAKQIQKVANMKDWRHNNGLDNDADFADFDPADQDLLFVVGEEETKYEFLPEGATSAGEKTLERLAWKIMCGTETPEIFFGKAVSGNLGSYEEQMTMAIAKAQRVRESLDYAYRELFKASLILCGIAESEAYDMDFEMGWNRLSSLSEKDRADILQKFCSSMASAMASGAIGISQVYQLWQAYYPELTYGTIEEFKAELVKTGNLMQFIKQDYATGETVIEAAGSLANVVNRTVK